MAQVGTAGRAAGVLRRPRARASRKRALTQLPLALAHVLAAVAIGLGLWSREERFLLPGEGAGYLLGIVGLSLMTIMLLYSARKRLRPLRALGRLSTGFQAHMILGLAGPVAILFHCNFQLGSFNSNLALFCTLVVAGSGVVGRVVYVRIHHRLSGQRATLEEVREHVDRSRLTLADREGSDELGRLLRGFEADALVLNRGLGPELLGRLLIGIRTRRTAWAARRILKGTPRETRRELDDYLRSVRRVAAFSLYERIFALWHAIHLPLCFLLFATAAVHVVAVHMF